MEQQGAGGGLKLFGVFIPKNPDQPSDQPPSEMKKPKRSLVILPPPQFQPLPGRYRHFLAGKGVSNPTLVFARTLYRTDVSKGHNRLSMPRDQVKASFLSDEEMRHIQQKDERGKPKKMRVMVVDAALEELSMNLTMWNMKNEKSSWWYALNNNWMDIVKRNKLVERDAIQIWSFRIDGKLWFLIHKLEADDHLANDVVLNGPNPVADDDDDIEGDDRDLGFDMKRRRRLNQ